MQLQLYDLNEIVVSARKWIILHKNIKSFTRTQISDQLSR